MLEEGDDKPQIPHRTQPEENWKKPLKDPLMGIATAEMKWGRGKPGIAETASEEEKGMGKYPS
jgi:hypothetical protein